MRFLQDRAHLAEVVGHEVERAGVEVRPGHMRQEVRDVTQPVAERAVQVRAVVQRVHLVDAHAGEVGRGASIASSSAPARRWRAAR